MPSNTRSDLPSAGYTQANTRSQNPPQFVYSANLDVNIGNPTSWSDFVDSVQHALDSLAEYVENLAEKEARYKDAQGRIALGGLGESCIIGMNLSPAIVDEIQRIGDAIGTKGCQYDTTEGTPASPGNPFISKTDEEYKKLNRT